MVTSDCLLNKKEPNRPFFKHARPIYDVGRLKIIEKQAEDLENVIVVIKNRL